MSDSPSDVIQISVTEQRYPRYDPAHGTPDPMVRRLVTLTLAQGTARFEQTDYGHAGRFNAWEPRGIDTPLLARTEDLKAVCNAVSPLLG